jgi:hypothetical protein
VFAAGKIIDPRKRDIRRLARKVTNCTLTLPADLGDIINRGPNLQGCL